MPTVVVPSNDARACLSISASWLANDVLFVSYYTEAGEEQSFVIPCVVLTALVKAAQDEQE